MRPQDEPARTCLKVEDWPAQDRLAWCRALADDDPLAECSSPAASWREATIHKNRRGYGRWLTFCENAGLNCSGDLADRVTMENLRAYYAELIAQHVAPYTLRNRFQELHAVLRTIAPDRDWRWLRPIISNLDAGAAQTADRSVPSVLALDILKRCRAELDYLNRPAIRSDAVTHRNWLMIGLLAILPLRLRNFAALEPNANMTRRDGIWYIGYDADKMKGHRDFAASIPREWSKRIDHYLEHVQPKIVGSAGTNTSGLWVACNDGCLAAHTIYLIVTRQTREAFGKPLNPHQLRHIFATTVSMTGTENIEGARAMLGHASPRTTRQHYVRASSIEASRRMGKIVGSCRRSRR